MRKCIIVVLVASFQSLLNRAGINPDFSFADSFVASFAAFSYFSDKVVL